MNAPITLAVGQVWEITEPSGKVRRFTIRSLQRGPVGQRIARGMTSGNHPVMVAATRLERGEHGAKLVSEAKAAS